METLGILETCLYVDDLERAERFYREVLGLTLLSRVEGGHVFFRLNDGNMFLLFKPEASIVTGELPGHGTKGPGHCCFRITEGSYDAWKTRLSEQGVPIISEYLWPTGAKSLYFNDPYGNVLELAPARLWGTPEGEIG